MKRLTTHYLVVCGELYIYISNGIIYIISWYHIYSMWFVVKVTSHFKSRVIDSLASYNYFLEDFIMSESIEVYSLTQRGGQWGRLFIRDDHQCDYTQDIQPSYNLLKLLGSVACFSNASTWIIVKSYNYV